MQPLGVLAEQVETATSLLCQLHLRPHPIAALETNTKTGDVSEIQIEIQEETALNLRCFTDWKNKNFSCHKKNILTQSIIDDRNVDVKMFEIMTKASASQLQVLAAPNWFSIQWCLGTVSSPSS